MKITSSTKLCAVIGYPLKHSLSPSLHTYVYDLLGIDAVLLAFDSQNLSGLLTAIKVLPVTLCTVTMPYKERIMEHLDTVDGEVSTVGAVNTLINRNGVLEGYNTDIIGIRKSFEGIEIKGKRVLICGAGGAAHASAYVLSGAGGFVTITNRDPERTDEFAAKFHAQTIFLSDVHAKDFDIIVNATPVGMHPHTAGTPLERFPFHEGHIVFDCIYNPPQTRLLQEAKAAGAKTISGLDMFLAQALAQIQLWTNAEVPEAIQHQAKKFLLTQLT